MAISTIFRKMAPRGFVRPADSRAGFSAAEGVPLADLGTYQGAVYLPFDAMVSEAPDYQASATQSQVENGETISDHVTLKPLKLVVQGIITDTPIGLIRQFTSVFQSPSPSKNAHTFLKGLWKNREPFDFAGGLDYYPSMVITNYSPTSTAETGDALKFTCTMEQVLTVFSQTLLTAKRAQKKQSRGQQPLGPIKIPTPVIRDSFHGVEPTAGTIGTPTTNFNSPSFVSPELKPLGVVGDPGAFSQPASAFPALR